MRTDTPVPEVAPHMAVIGPESLLSAARLASGYNPPIFITGKTIKKRYADDLRMWIEMMGEYASNEKFKFELLNAGFKIYRFCDEQARNILDEARACGNMILKGNDDEDPLRTKLVEKIIGLISTESVPEKTNRKVALLKDISSCTREDGEIHSLFAARFKSLVAKYAVQIGHIDHNSSCRMALMMIHNERLQPSIQSNMVIQLSGKNNNNNNRMRTYVQNKKSVESFLDYMHEFNKDLDPEEPILQHELVDKITKLSE